MPHEIRLIRCLSEQATAVLLSHQPIHEPINRLKSLDPPRKTRFPRMLAQDWQRRQFLARSLRQLFSGAEGSKIIAVLSYAPTWIIAARQADKRGRRIRYGVDAGGPFKRTVYRRTGPFQRKALVQRISFEELLCYAKDPEGTYRGIYSLIIDGAVAILGLEKTQSILQSEPPPTHEKSQFCRME